SRTACWRSWPVAPVDRKGRRRTSFTQARRCFSLAVPRRDLPFLQVVLAPGLHGFVVGLPRLDGVLRVVEVDLAAPHHFPHAPLYDERRRLVEAQTEELRITLQEGRHVALALALREVLVDGNTRKEAEAAFVALAHHLDVAERAAATEIVPLDRRAGRTAA